MAPEGAGGREGVGEGDLPTKLKRFEMLLERWESTSGEGEKGAAGADSTTGSGKGTSGSQTGADAAARKPTAAATREAAAAERRKKNEALLSQLLSNAATGCRQRPRAFPRARQAPPDRARDADGGGVPGSRARPAGLGRPPRRRGPRRDRLDGRAEARAPPSGRSSPCRRIRSRSESASTRCCRPRSSSSTRARSRAPPRCSRSPSG